MLPVKGHYFNQVNEVVKLSEPGVAVGAYVLNPQLSGV